MAKILFEINFSHFFCIHVFHWKNFKRKKEKFSISRLTHTHRIKKKKKLETFTQKKFTHLSYAIYMAENQ